MKETIERKNIIITKNIQNKEQLFHYLAEYMVSQKEIDAKHQEAFEQALWSREQLSVTGVMLLFLMYKRNLSPDRL